MMEFLVDNWVTIFAGLAAVLTALKLVSVLKYVNFAKEVGDIYVSYEKGSAADSPDGADFTPSEKQDLGQQVIEAIESGKVTFKKKKE